MDVRHILVEKHSDAVKILEDIKSGTHCIPSSQPRGPRSRAVLGELSFICIYEYKIIGYLYNCLFLLQKNLIWCCTGKIPFNDAARQHSIDKAGKCGLLGWKTQAELDPVCVCVCVCRPGVCVCVCVCVCVYA